MRRVVGALLFVLALPASPARAEPLPEPLRDVGIDQRLGERVPLDLALRDESGAAVRLGDYFGRTPVILSLAYYDCPMLCTLVLNGMVRALNALPFDVGDRFAVVTVSIDPQETPALAAAKKEVYLGNYRRPGAAAGWHFLTGEADALARLADAVGFRYRRDERSGDFAHAAGIMVLTPDGTIARYLLGVEYAPRDLRLALVEAAEGRIGSIVDQLLLFCFQYDASMGRYSAAIMNIVRLGGLLTLIALVVGIVMMRRREPRVAAISLDGVTR
jgi:protein SCO1/2